MFVGVAFRQFSYAATRNPEVKVFKPKHKFTPLKNVVLENIR